VALFAVVLFGVLAPALLPLLQGARRADPAIWEVLPSSTRVVAELPGKVESWPPPVDVKTPTRRGREGQESRRNTYRCG
jgi:hypothetical protein